MSKAEKSLKETYQGIVKLLEDKIDNSSGAYQKSHLKSYFMLVLPKDQKEKYKVLQKEVEERGTNDRKYIKHFNGLSPEDKVELVKKTAQSVSKAFKKKEKALQQEHDFTGARTGVRGGKRTTLAANATTACKEYEDMVHMLQLFTKLL